MATGRVAEKLNERLEGREGEKDIYKISNLRKWQRQDLAKLGVIRDRDGNIVYRDENIEKRRRKYFEQLLNIENEREEMEEAQRVEGPVVKIQDREIKRALSKMKNGKASGPSEFQIEMIKLLGTEGEKWMLDILKAIWEEEEIPRN
ncbi:uncharacterized protein LOC135203904 [Macrobrachium nipponense]|uniref:uncharacterized protein LOC135203904 n=1 Tax=Macrobrachium nipponense TaxID=159736 RepID=UPI0030C8CA4F